MRQNRWMVGTALAAALVASLPVEAAAKPKQVLSAVVNGRRFTAKNKHVTAGLTGEGISIVGGTPPVPHVGQTIRALTVTCAAGLGGGLPAPGQVCTIAYTETKVAAHPTSKEWQAPYGGPTVTFTSFAGTRVNGTFEGTLDPVFGATAPVTVTKGTFNVLVR